MVRILRAFAWMRWRVFINSIEKSGARDAVERFSLAIEHIAPLLVLIVMIPSIVALAGLSGYAGFQLALSGDRTSIPFQLLRYLLLGATLFAIVGQILMPVSDRTNAVRLLLLPIPSRVLYIAQAAGAFADPWVLFTVPVITGLTIGLAAGGALVAAGVALIAGLALLATILGLASLTTTIVHVVMQDRRRGELVALIFIVILPFIGIIPAAFDDDDNGRSRRRARQEASREEPAPQRRSPVTQWMMTAGGRAFRIVPSELYVRGLSSARESGARSAALPVMGLAATAVLLHGLGVWLFQRVLSTAGSSGPRRTASARGAWSRPLPGVSLGTSAVALAFLRLALRTPRGRSIVLAPILMMAVFGVLIFQAGSFNFGPFGRGGGFSLGVFISAVALLAILPLSMNQFAVDGAGLTTTLLAPLTARQILVGKAIGAALVILPPAIVCVIIIASALGGAHPALWMSLPPGLAATYILTSPAAAAFSAVLPRAVDMNSIGKGSNAHGLSGLLGILGFGLASVPAVAIVLASTTVLHRPWLAPVLMLVWCGIAVVIAALLFGIAERIFEARRENLAMLM